MHGRPRTAPPPDPVRQKEDLIKLSDLQSSVIRSHRQKDYSKEALQQNAKLLEINPEIYTAWNYRKLAVTHMLESQPDLTLRKNILDEELKVVEKALRRNVKCYGAWYHRKWVIQFGLSSLEHEYQLLDYLLTSDARNFHGWNYRRFLAKVHKTTEEQELQFTMKKINENFSNYSAWHNRSVLLTKQCKEAYFEKDEWLEVLTEEYDLVKQAFFTEPEDQSGWFYLTWLLGQTLKSRVGPSRTGFWPSNGMLVTLNLSASYESSYWSYKMPHSKQVCHNSRYLSIVLSFSDPVSGVDSSSITLAVSPEVQGFDYSIPWTPLKGNKKYSHLWVANIEAPNAGFVVGSRYTIYLDVGRTGNIMAEDGATFNSRSLEFHLEVCTESPDHTHENPMHGSCVIWPEDNPTSSLQCEPVKAIFMDGFPKDESVNSQRAESWQLKMLQSQIDTCRELLDLEKDSKWTMLILARLLTAYDNLSCSEFVGKPHIDEVRQLYNNLVNIDPKHRNYYSEQLSCLLFEQITRNSHDLLNHWWQYKESDYHQEGWLRLNNLSLTKLGRFDRLIWVQRLDLRNNDLQSLEGIEVLQLLVSLDASYNQLSTVASLWPIHYLLSLKALNLKCNQIGARKVDTNRYLLSSRLNNSLAEGPEYLDCWEAVELFKGLELRQLEIFGNPIASNDHWRLGIMKALPSLVWLDGIRISS